MSNKMGRPIELDGNGGPWNTLAYAVGGVDKLAELLHVSRRTIDRYSKKNPDRIPFAFRQLVNDIAHANSCAAPFPKMQPRKLVG